MILGRLPGCSWPVVAGLLVLVHARGRAKEAQGGGSEGGVQGGSKRIWLARLTTWQRGTVNLKGVGILGGLELEVAVRAGVWAYQQGSTWT